MNRAHSLSVALTAIALLFFGWTGCSSDSSPPQTNDTDGPVDIPCTAESCFIVGQFSVDWNTDSAPALRVRHAEEPDRVLWQSSDKTPLVTAGVLENAISASRGSFTFDFTSDEVCEASAIDTVTAEGDAVVVTGSFSDCPLGFTLTYSAAASRRLRAGPQ